MATISCKDVSDSLRIITLAERMDIQGTEKIEAELATLTRCGRNVAVDLCEVTFLSSVGIRAMVANGKALKAEGRKMGLVVGSNAAAEKTLKVTCTDALLPLFATQAEAAAALGA